MVIAIVEPLKIRWLNCTETQLGYRTIKFNHLVGNLVRKNEVFFPSREPVQLKHIKFLENFDYACSQDYSGATDTILCRYSRMVLRKLCVKMFGEEEGLEYFNGTDCALTKFNLVYEDGEPFRQTMGQLMGSTEEFIVLMEEFSGIDKMILDPNDDSLLEICNVICKSDKREYYPKMNSVWYPIISLVGFSSSPGKCYIHDKFCCINSVYFVRTDKESSYSRIYPTQLSLMFNDPEESNSGLGNRKNKDLKEK